MPLRASTKMWLRKDSVRKNFEGYAGLKTHKNIKIAGTASQLCVSTI